MQNMVFDTMQANLAFVVSQASHIEAQVYSIKYADIQYQDLIPVDVSANPWVKSVTYYSMDGAGRAEWLSGSAGDIPLVGTAMAKVETDVHMAGIGYDYGMEEIEQARMLGLGLEVEKARYARRAYEEFVDRVALEGDAAKGFSGLFAHPAIAAAFVANGAGGSPLWADKTPDEIILDVNNLIVGVHSATNTVAMADTVLLPWPRYLAISSQPRSPTSDTTVLTYLQRNNVYTAATGRPLTIRGIRGLDARGLTGSARMIAYRRDPEVLKLHIPMPHRFFSVQVSGLRYLIPGAFRLGGLDIRLPREVRYGDGI